MRSPLAIVVSFGLGLGFGIGCVSQQTPPPNGPPGTVASDSGSGSDVECHDETPTGSSISHQVCRQKTSPDDKLNQPGVMSDMQGPHNSPGKGQ
jgi:hypothetical protein